MPLASAARLRKPAKEPLVVRGQLDLRSPSKGRQQSIDRTDEERKITVRRRSSSVGRTAAREEQREKKEEETHRVGDSSCDGCGKVHHGLLQLQYTQSLEQQIALLELENNYLLVYDQPPSRHILPPILRPPPSSHLPPSTSQSHRHQQQFQPRPPLWTEMIPEVRESPPSTGDRETRRERSGMSDESGRRDGGGRNRSTDTDLLHRLEEYSQKLLGLERKLKEKMRESRSKEESINSLQNRLRELEGNLNTRTDSDAQQKRALMEEILDLQRRLDELTPILAQKEALIARLENEKDELNVRMRGMQSENSQLHIRMGDRGREESMRVEQEEERRRERQRMEMVVREKEGEVEAARTRDRIHIEEMTRMRREVREEEIKRGQQKAILDKLTEENGKLVKECSKLSAEVSRLEIRSEHAERDNQLRQIEKEASRELAEMKERENTLRIELTQAQEALHTERECSSLLQNQLKDGSSRENEIRDARNRMERELEALHALSKSLSAENTTLRQERLSHEETIDSLKMKILEKERLLHEMTEKLRESDRKYEDALARVEEESSVQRQRTIELEELGQKLKDLSESLPRSTHNSATRSSTVSREMIQSGRSHDLHRSLELSSHRSAPQPRPHPCSMPPVVQPFHSRATIDEVIEMTRSALGTMHQ
ncbi:hypothetical protein PFISCL1PPCAC_23691 [Pristionchus fissidentatus]|uniref:Uncharacterized protein n=1 Tax=Pristionchus fissidentatus TaxID=1538716 RepID=A0AAV5WRP9_9BILA|nr:hypothetical protein PFISCL1PPCAC_23691 [Pristionchus fissidentatus]